MRLACVLLFASFALAQTPKAQVAYQCVPEQLDAAGLTCTNEHPCAVYLELAAIETLAGKIFLTGNLHTADVTLASVLLASDDGGRTWTEPHARVDGAGLEQIQFVDFQNGWISGLTLQGRPRDGFLLITHDGGKTWRSYPLFEEPRVGIIQQFWFDSKNNGALLVDRMQPNESGSRYELYESLTGGESWMLREVSSRPITFKRARGVEPNADWRLRPDGASKTYQIEQRLDGRWRTVAVFPIHVTDCRKAEPKMEETPPPDEDVKPAEPPKPPSLKKKK